MDEKKFYMGAGALIFVLLLVAVFMPRDSGPDVKDLIARELGPVSEAVADLGARVDGVEGSLGEISEQLSAVATPEDVAAVQARVDEVAAQTGALNENIAAMQSTLSETVEAVKAAPVAAAPAEQDNAAAPGAADADGPAGMKPGQTMMLADGALRLFVSRLDTEAGAVRVSAMGQMKTLIEGQARTLAVGDDYCRITVDSVSGNGAVFDAVCGDDLPAPVGISAGETALLEDGAIRVFASRIIEDMARLSINGTSHELGIGRSAPAMAGEESCRVMLDALDRGHAEVSAICGADVAVSELAGPGSTVLLGDGAARVFVAGIAEDKARFAVNGQTVTTGATGAKVDLGEGCGVVVEDVTDGKVSFSYGC